MCSKSVGLTDRLISEQRTGNTEICQEGQSVARVLSESLHEPRFPK